MDILKKVSDRMKGSISLGIKRYIYADIDFSARLIVLKGARGVGKTTLMLQYLKEECNPATSMFLSLDHFIFTERRLIEVIDDFYEEGYRFFALDEVHKYPSWSVEIKNIYDSYPDIKMIVTASSALDIMKGMADLSRRADVYLLHGLSFREYLIFEHSYELEKISFDDIINHHVPISHDLVDEMDVLKYFRAYNKIGYYPFFKESKARYHDRIRAILNQVIEVDLPAIFSMDYNSIRQLKKLLFVISRIAPFTPNISKLARELEIGRNRILLFLDYLHAAGAINILKSAQKSDSALAKPDKVFLDNPNMVHALGLNSPNPGTIRETYFMNSIHVSESVSTPVRGDFLINGAYVAEVGGPNKSWHQIYDMPNPILVKDGIETGTSGVIPIWMFGFLY